MDKWIKSLHLPGTSFQFPSHKTQPQNVHHIYAQCWAPAPFCPGIVGRGNSIAPAGQRQILSSKYNGKDHLVTSFHEPVQFIEAPKPIYMSQVIGEGRMDWTREEAPNIHLWAWLRTMLMTHLIKTRAWRKGYWACVLRHTVFEGSFCARWSLEILSKQGGEGVHIMPSSESYPDVVNCNLKCRVLQYTMGDTMADNFPSWVNIQRCWEEKEH